MNNLLKTDSNRDILDLIDRIPVPIINHETNPPSYHFKMPKWSQGGNWQKEGFKTIKGETDWDVMLTYLNRHRPVENSYLAYCSAVEKLILFLLVNKKMISELTREDFESFYTFLAHPEPSKYWVGDRHRKFDMKSSDDSNKFINPDWRPFVGKYNYSVAEYNKLVKEAPPGTQLPTRRLEEWGMGEKSIVDVSVKIGTMFRDLFVGGHLKTIPVIPKKVRSSLAKTKLNLIEHFLEKRLVHDVIRIINDQIETLRKYKPERTGDIFSLVRDRFIIKLFFTTGVRINELSEAKNSSITDINNRWVLNILGKGDKPRQITLFKDSIKAINEFRGELKKGSPLLAEKKKEDDKINCYSGAIRSTKELDWALVPQRDLVSHICRRRIDQLIKPHFQMLADEYKINSEDKKLSEFKRQKFEADATRLEMASAHWLRHSHGTYFSMECDKDMKAIMERMGHSKADTTMIYLHVVDEWFGEGKQTDYSVSY